MTENEMYKRLHANRKLGYIEEIPAWDFIEDDGRTLEEHLSEERNNIKKSQLSNLGDRIKSEGMGRVEFVEGYNAPKYTEIYEDEEKSEQIDLEKAKDQIEGGLADKLSIEQIAEKHGVSVKSINRQIKKGIKVEMEHTDDKDKAAEIAKDHLTEDPKYYTRLAKMEDEAKKENKDNEK